MSTKKYKRLNYEERVIIETLLGESKSKAFIAKKLNRSRSTITREINKWVKNPGDIYNAKLADCFTFMLTLWVITSYHNKAICRRIRSYAPASGGSFFFRLVLIVSVY